MADTLYYLRIRRRWSRETLSLETGLNRTMIGATERAEVNTTLGMAKKIARAFELPLAELLSLTPPKEFGPPDN